MLWPLLQTVSANVLTIPWTHGVPTDEAHCQVFVILMVEKESENLPSNHSPSNPDLLHLHPSLSLYPSHTHFLRHCLDLEIPYSPPFSFLPWGTIKTGNSFPSRSTPLPLRGIWVVPRALAFPNKASCGLHQSWSIVNSWVFAIVLRLERGAPWSLSEWLTVCSPTHPTMGSCEWVQKSNRCSVPCN